MLRLPNSLLNVPQPLLPVDPALTLAPNTNLIPSLQNSRALVSQLMYFPVLLMLQLRCPRQPWLELDQRDRG